MTKHITRLAPSPTGTLHLGNARTFLINWALARQRGWEIVMRIEDLDMPRIRPGAAESALETLAWLGINFDHGPYYQSHDLEPYRNVMRKLTTLGLAYPCELTRKQIEQAASAPHKGDGELLYPARLRPMLHKNQQFRREDCNYRYAVPDQAVRIDDAITGTKHFRPCDEVGDFVVWTKLGVPSYQLAVVVDDARQGVSHVVRGDDLLPSAARQTLLYQALNLSAPRWWHVPLIIGPDGRRLAKRHGGAQLQTYRNAGVRAQRVVGLLAYWSGVSESRQEMTADDFRKVFNVDTLSRSQVAFAEDDFHWLVEGCSRKPSFSY